MGSREQSSYWVCHVDAKIHSINSVEGLFLQWDPGEESLKENILIHFTNFIEGLFLQWDPGEESLQDNILHLATTDRELFAMFVSYRSVKAIQFATVLPYATKGSVTILIRNIES